MIENETRSEYLSKPVEAVDSNQQNPETPYDKEAVMQGIAQSLVTYSLEVEPGDVVWIQFETLTGDMAKLVVEEIEKAGGNSMLSFSDDALDKDLAEALNKIGEYSLPTEVLDELQLGDNTLRPVATDNGEDQKQADFMFSGPASDAAHFLSRCNKVLRMVTRKSLESDIRNKKLKKNIDATEKRFNSTMSPLTKIRVNETRWCLYRPPTQAEADAIGMPFSEYEQRYYEACNRPWDEVEKAQDVLVEMLEQGKKFIVDVPAPAGMDSQRWHTHLEMGINGKRDPESGVHTFINSVAKRNMPGSEVFTAPDAGTVNGTLAIPYVVMLKDRSVPNLILRFKDGKVIKKEDGTFDFDTDGDAADRAHIQKILSTDEGASAIGELGIGTNPAVDFPVLNTLLNEKISGIHLAIGKAYTYKEYLGTPVDVNNGNVSDIHIDISRIMAAEWGGGTMTIIKDIPSENGVQEQAEVIFENGRFLDPRLAVLNKAE